MSMDFHQNPYSFFVHNNEKRKARRNNKINIDNRLKTL